MFKIFHLVPNRKMTVASPRICNAELTIKTVFGGINPDDPDQAAFVFFALAGSARPNRTGAVHAFDRVDVAADAAIAKTVDLIGMMTS